VKPSLSTRIAVALRQRASSLAPTGDGAVGVDGPRRNFQEVSRKTFLSLSLSLSSFPNKMYFISLTLSLSFEFFKEPHGNNKKGYDILETFSV
jgi:hypothetical protein